MFGHGQVEGYTEKYGMEYRGAKLDESPDDGLIRGHEWRIFPLLHRRSLFADVEQFLLYDFYVPNGSVNEEVFAYSNRFNDERGLVIYHNKFADTRGWIKTSAAFINKSSGKTLRKNIAEGIGLPRVGYVIFKDYVTQLEYIRSCKEIWDKGMYIELGAYQCHAFMDWRFVGDSEWKAICDNLNGAGVQSMQDEWKKLFKGKDEGLGMKDEDEVVNSKKPVSARKVSSRTKKERGKKKEVVVAKSAKTKASAKKATVAKKVLPKAKKPVVRKVVSAKAKPEKKSIAKASSVTQKKVVPKKVSVKKPEKKKVVASKKSK
jgi:hypothetical protein